MIDKATAAKIAEILVVECGASAENLKDWGFERYVSLPLHGFPIEFRFVGNLGSGGKFKADGRGQRWRVDCYREDATEWRERMIRKANERLSRLEEANGEGQG